MRKRNLTVHKTAPYKGQLRVRREDLVRITKDSMIVDCGDDDWWFDETSIAED